MVKRALPALLFLLAVCGAALAESLTVEMTVESSEVYVGEQFVLQLRVEGSADPEEPDLRAIRDFDYSSLGGQANNTEYVSIVGGKVTRSTTLGYVFRYQLTARRAGTFTIPAVTVRADGRSATSAPLRIVVAKPQDLADFRLTLELSRPAAYVGEGIELVVTWYVSAPVRNAYFVIPFLSNPAFRFRTPEPDVTPGGTYSKVRVNDEETVVELGEGVLQGSSYTTVRFARIVTPLTAGTFELPEATVQFEARVEPVRRRSLIESFFDSSAGGDYRPFATTSRRGTLRVSALPSPAPAGFAGHVGRYVLRASATPLEATVGDPITLTLTMTGPLNVLDAPPPTLAGQAVERDFTVQESPAQALPSQTGLRSPEKAYAFTVRAARAGSSEIPAIELPYFDPQSGAYSVARSAPVPIRVVQARVVGARDAEGEPTPQPRSALPPQSSDESGISFNYEGGRALRPQYPGLGSVLRRPLALGMFLLALASVALSAALSSGRRWLAGRARGGRTAFRRCARELRALAGAADREPQASLDGALRALTGYFALRLGLPPGGGTFGDVEKKLRASGLREEHLTELRDAYRVFEAGRYAAFPLGGDAARDALLRALAAAEAVEDHLSSGERDRGRGGLLALLLTLSLLFPAASSAQAPAAGGAASLFKKANETFRAANEAAAKSPSKARELYRSAAALYERLIDGGARGSAMLYYDLGNAYYRLGELGRAILSYRRASLLEPSEPNLRHNLEQARLDREDRFTSPDQAPAARVLLFWHRDFSPGTRGLLAGILALLSAALVSTWLFLRRPALLRGAIAAAFPVFLFLGSLTADSLRLSLRREGVIVATEVVARLGDGEIFEPSFQRPLHAGTEFVLIEDRREWLRIELPDRRRCWIPSAAAELVRPREPREP